MPGACFVSWRYLNFLEPRFISSAVSLKASFLLCWGILWVYAFLLFFFLSNREMDGIWGKTFERNSSTIIHKTFLSNRDRKKEFRPLSKQNCSFYLASSSTTTKSKQELVKTTKDVWIRSWRKTETTYCGTRLLTCWDANVHQRQHQL